MTAKDIYRIWAPVGVKWSAWVRPVPFIGIDSNYKVNEFYDFTIPSINYIDKLCNDTAIIIDTPGYSSIKEGIGLAKMGFRPVPIFNGTNEQLNSKATTNNRIVESALIWGASELEKISIKTNSSPVFLLDSNRMNRYKMDESIFDNSWDIYHQDIPTADYFLESGINKIIVRGEGKTIEKDLSKVLYKFQKKNIKILFTDGYEEPKEVKLKRPAHKDI